jgi:hypothetical protein
VVEKLPTLFSANHNVSVKFNQVYQKMEILSVVGANANDILG